MQNQVFEIQTNWHISEDVKYANVEFLLNKVWLNIEKQEDKKCQILDTISFFINLCACVHILYDSVKIYIYCLSIQPFHDRRV